MTDIDRWCESCPISEIGNDPIEGYKRFCKIERFEVSHYRNAPHWCPLLKENCTDVIFTMVINTAIHHRHDHLVGWLSFDWKDKRKSK